MAKIEVRFPVMKIKKKVEERFSIGDLVVEKKTQRNQKRIGEIIFVRDGRKRKLEMVELNKHDLRPIQKGSLDGPKIFSLDENACKKLNLFRFKEKRTFQIGDIIKFSKHGRSRFGILTSFIHPDGLYSDSFEKGYNGRDLLECIEILPKNGLPRRLDEKNKPFIFLASPKHSKCCVIIPMDQDGGVRIKERSFFVK
jgi:hypothetical protein